MVNFVFQIEKKELDDKIELNIYSKDNKNNTKHTKTNINYQILAKKEEFETLNINSDKIILTNESFLNKNNEKIAKYYITNKELHEYILKQCREAEIITHETDLTAEHRYIIDNPTKPLLKNSKTFETPDLKQLSIDIETIGPDINNQEIVMISSYSPQDKKQNRVYINTEKIDKNKLKKDSKQNYKPILAKNEPELLESFKKNVIEFEPQIIIGWNVIDFDFKVIRERMKFHNIEFKFSKFDGVNKLRINKDFFKDSTLNIPGVLVYDAIHLLRMNFITFEDYKLDTVAKAVLGDSKIDLQEEDDDMQNKLEAINTMITSNPSKLADYNFKDSVLTSQIIDKLKLLRLMVQRSIITNTPMLKVKSPIASLDIMYLSELHKRGYIASSNFNFNDSNQIEGAYVIEPKSGFYDNIFVLDFKSLYPSIIMTFNIDPFTYCENGEINAPNGAKFDKKEGILPELILKLYKERDIAKQKNDKIKSNALKLTMNSFYGSIASTKSRFHNHEVGGAITAFARHITQKAQKYIEGLGHQVIYGDTDSIFIKFNKEFKSFNDKKKFGFEIEQEINNYFTNWVETKYKQKSFLKIEFEKLYSKFFVASKKRYVGYDEFTKKTQFVGMEAIRGDWTELAKNFQVNLVNQMFQNKSKNEITQYIKKYIKELESGKFDDLLVYTKKITKPLEQYTKTTPPHVKAARELDEFRGRTVKYVMGKSGPKHISLVNKNFEFDYSHYIEKQIGGVSDDLLNAFGIDIKKLISMQGQSSLNKFF